MPMTNPLAIAVEKHALEHYNDDFEWSVIYECWEEREILEELSEENITTVEAAIEHFAKIVGSRSDSDYGGKGSENW